MNIMKQVSLNELVKVAQDWSILKGEDKTVFENLILHKGIDILSTNVDQGTDIANEIFQTFIRNVNSSFKTVHLTTTDADTVKFLSDFCENSTLHINEQHIRKFCEFSELLNRIKKLHLNGISSIANITDKYHQVVQLTIETDSSLVIADIVLPMLRNLKIRCSDCDGIEKFVMRYQTLRKFHFDGPFENNPIRQTITNDLILKHLRNITYIRLYNASFRSDVRRFHRLHNLESITLCFGTNSVAKFCVKVNNTNVSLREVKITGEIDDMAIGSLSLQKTLERVSVIDCIGFDDNKLIRLLLTLPVLNFITCPITDTSVFQEQVLPLLTQQQIEFWEDSDRDEDRRSYVSFVFLSTQILFT